MFDADENHVFYSSKQPNENIMSQLLKECEDQFIDASQGGKILPRTGNTGRCVAQEPQESLPSINLNVQDDGEKLKPLSEKQLHDPMEQFSLLVNHSASKCTAADSPDGRQGCPKKTPYKRECRQIKLDRYRQKKARRKWEQTVSYYCRKVVADSRERVNGRFIKKPPSAKRSLLSELLQQQEGHQPNVQREQVSEGQ